MTAKLFIALTLIGSIFACHSIVKADNNPTFNCFLNPQINADSGTIEFVGSAKTDCHIYWENGTNIFGIQTDNLVLEEGDSFRLSDVDTGIQTYRPPLDAGYFISGQKEPALKFFFNRSRDINMRIPFFRNQLSLPINGDINNYFEITPVDLKQFNLNFKKTLKEYIHFEIIGAKIANTGLNHLLIPNDTYSLMIPIIFEDNRVAKVRTSRAHPNCSGSFIDSSEAIHKISGPVASSETSKYKCVNIFQSKQLHYDVDFTDFIELVDHDDELILDDGKAQERVHIVKPEDQQNITTLSFSGNELAVIYNNPRKIKPLKDVQFKLTVKSKALGGLVTAPGFLNLNSDGQARFVLRPTPEKFAAIKIAKQFKLQSTNITILSGTRPLASFNENSYLPPILVGDNPNTDLILDITTKNFKSLEKVLEFVNLDQSCHKIFPGASGSLNVASGQSCYFTLASAESVALSINYHDGGCFKIKSLEREKPFYDRCNLTISEVLPTFILKRVLVEVNLTTTGKLFDGAVSTYRYNTVTKLQATNELNITSPLYPIYPKLNEKHVNSLNGTNQSFVFSINDVDIRKGEKLTLNQIDINDSSDDIIASNKISNLTLDSNDNTDYQLHRGYSLTARRYDSIIIADSNKNQLLTPKNITSAYIKISTKGHRIEYNISSTVSKDFELLVFDGRTTSLQRTQYNSSTQTGSSTSDTLLFSYKTVVGNSYLPELKLSYRNIPCNKSIDHICDNNTRCVPYDRLCKGVQYCVDKTDIKRPCSAGPQPNSIMTGFSGATLFVLTVLMFTLGVAVDRYGPHVYKNLEDRFRSGQYTAFSSVE